MKNKKVSVQTIIIIVLIGIIIALISINLNNKNTNIAKQETETEQLEQITGDNVYVKMQTHLSEVNDQEEKLLTFKSVIATAITNESVATASTDTAETMASNIEGILKARTTLSEDVAATADNITEGKQAWVNGELITGNGTDNVNSSKIEIRSISLTATWTSEGANNSNYASGSGNFSIYTGNRKKLTIGSVSKSSSATITLYEQSESGSTITNSTITGAKSITLQEDTRRIRISFSTGNSKYSSNDKNCTLSNIVIE